MTEVNALLREHVLRTRFELTLTKTQISALIELDAFAKRESAPYPTWIHFRGLPGMDGLQRRGLVSEMHWPVDGSTYEISRAGELVVELLKESGIYQHYMATMPAAVAS